MRKSFDWNKVWMRLPATLFRTEAMKKRNNKIVTAFATCVTTAVLGPACVLFLDDSLHLVDHMRPYARIDAVRHRVLPNLSKPCHDYGLRGLAQPHTGAPTEDEPIICSIPACGGLVLHGHKHYKSHSAKVHKRPF